MAITIIFKKSSRKTMATFKKEKIAYQKKNKAKRVRFMEDEDIEQIEMYENPQDIWFTKSEEMEIQIKALEMRKRLLRETNGDPAEFEIKFFNQDESPRGLDQIIILDEPDNDDDDTTDNNNIIKAMNHRRRSSIAVVIQTQNEIKRQRQQQQQRPGTGDNTSTSTCQESSSSTSSTIHDMIACAYREATRESAQEAMERAQQDEKFVLDWVRRRDAGTTMEELEHYHHRIFEKRSERPTLLWRQNATRSLFTLTTTAC